MNRGFVDLFSLENGKISSLAEELIINTLPRHQFLKTPWYLKGWRWQEQRRLNISFFKQIQAYFRQKLEIEEERVFLLLWKRALAMARIEWNKKKPLTVKLFREIEAALEETLIYQGEGIKMPPLHDQDDPAFSQMYYVTQYLLGKEEFSMRWIDWKTVKGIFFRKDPTLFTQLQEEFRRVLASCAQAWPSKERDQEFQAFISHVLSLLPYTYPEKGTVFLIPQKVEGEWRNCRYVVDQKVELGPRMFSSSIPACGLLSEEGPPLLIFLGTTYPAGDGFAATFLTNVTPGFSIGHASYWFGKRNIALWLKDKRGVRLFGISLGGAFAFHTLRDYREKIEQVHVYSPPGLYWWDWKERYDHAPEIHIYHQNNDLIPTLGVFPQGKKVAIYQVISDHTENTLKAHIRIYTGRDRVFLLKSTPEFENKRILRMLLTLLHLSCGVFIFFPFFLVYLFYLLGAFCLKTFKTAS